MTKAKPLPFTAEELREMLNYCPETGVFTWKMQTGSRAAVGKEAGNIHHTGYHNIRIKRITYQAHRLAWLHYYGKEPKKYLDHVNGVKNDNSIKNLREASQQENMCNQGRPITNKTGFKGVSWVERIKKYHAQCQVAGKKYRLGYYLTPEEAYQAYVAFVTEHHGEFARVA